MNDENMNTAEEKKKKKRRVLIMVILLVILAIVIGALICSSYSARDRHPPATTSRGQSQTDTSTDTSNGSVTSGTAARKSTSEILQELQKQVVMATPDFLPLITFNSGKKGATGNWQFQNLKKNTVAMEGQVYDNEKLIAETPVLKPDQYVSAVTLLSNIPTGTRHVDIVIKFFNLKTNALMATSTFHNATLNVG